MHDIKQMVIKCQDICKKVNLFADHCCCTIFCWTVIITEQFSKTVYMPQVKFLNIFSSLHHVFFYLMSQ